MAKPILIVRVNDLTPSEDREKARENWILATDNEYHVIVLSSRNVYKHSQPIIEVHGEFSNDNSYKLKEGVLSWPQS